MLSSILWLLLAIIVVAWLFGAFVANIGSIVHLLLVIAAIILIYNLFVAMAGGRRTTL